MGRTTTKCDVGVTLGATLAAACVAWTGCVGDADGLAGAGVGALSSGREEARGGGLAHEAAAAYPAPSAAWPPAHVIGAGPEHGFRSVATAGPARFAAVAPRGVLRADVEAHGAAFTAVGAGAVADAATGEGWRVVVSFAGVGGDARPRAAGAVRAAGNRVEIDRGDGVTEWWRHGPAGFEQGFVIARPVASADGSIEVLLDVAGAQPRATDDGEVVTLVDDAGRRLISVSSLFAHDATGRSLPARFDVRARRLALVIDAEGAEYPVEIDPLYAEAALTPPDALEDHDFGRALATDGGWLVVGAPGDDSLGDLVGSVYVYRWATAGWVFVQKIDSPSDTERERFGYAVDLDGETFAVGRPGTGMRRGAVEVYTLAAGVWTLRHTVVPDDDGCLAAGSAVALDGDTLVIGAPETLDEADERYGGAVYVYRRAGDGWALEATIMPPTPTETRGFGTAVDVDGEVIVVGAPGVGAHETRPGAAYLFGRSGGRWSLLRRLEPAGLESGDELGCAVAIEGRQAVVGECEDDTMIPNGGAVHVYSLAAPDGWGHRAVLRPARLDEGARFGRAVEVRGDLIAVGAPMGRAIGMYPGDAHLFRHGLLGWFEIEAIDRRPTNDAFGSAVALGDDLLVVGAPDDDTALLNTGAVHTYLLALADGSACPGQFRCRSGQCVDGVCCESACGSGVTDCQVCSVAAGGVEDGVCGPLTEARAAAVVCRAEAGPCDVADTCQPLNTTCPADRRRAAGQLCRASAGSCDVAEVCTGDEADCPADRLVPAGGECRPTAGPCDVADHCDGASVGCPVDVLARPGVICRAAMGPCDVVERCTGAMADCPTDRFAEATVECRAPAGGCDRKESCTGLGPLCPADELAGAGEVCREVAGDCDVAETCSGGDPACPADSFLPGTTVCRAASGPCDAAERCPGGSPLCPANELAAIGAVCRASTGPCDAPEVCLGLDADCRPDRPEARDGVECDDGVDWTAGDACRRGWCAGEEVGSCERPVVVDALPFEHRSTTFGRQDRVPAAADGCAERVLATADTVYEVRAAPGERVVVALEPSADFDGALVLLESCGSPTVCAEWVDDGGDGEAERLELLVGESGVVVFAVDSNDESAGPYTLSVELAALPEPDAGDDPGDAGLGDGGGPGSPDAGVPDAAVEETDGSPDSAHEPEDDGAPLGPDGAPALNGSGCAAAAGRPGGATTVLGRLFAVAWQ